MPLPEEHLLALQFLGRVLQEVPDREFLTSSRGLPSFLADICGAINIIPEAPEDPQALDHFQTDLAEDHLHLFSGPDPLAPPWESVWLERDHLLFGETTEQVALCYDSWGVENAGAGKEPADHLGLELAFLAWLVQKDLKGELSRKGQTAREAIIEFLDKHTLKFSPELLKKAQEEAHTTWYATICALCSAWLELLYLDYR